MPRQLRVALITEPTGNHLSSLIDALSNDEVGEVALGDETGETFEQIRASAGDIVKTTYTDLAKLYTDFAPDVVLVTLESWRTPAVITQALEAGAHVFHEKPGFVNIDDYRAVYRLAKSKDLHLAVAYASRMRAIVQEARRIIATGLIGDLFACQAWFIADHDRTHNYATLGGGWIFDKQRSGGGHLTFLGCHYLDLLRFLTGANFATVTSLCQVVGGEPLGVEDAAAVTLGFDNGMVGTLSSGYYVSRSEYRSARHSGLMVWGRDGWLRFNPGGERTGEPLQWMSQRGVEAESPLKSWTFDKQDAAIDEYRLLTQAFLRACLGDEPPPVLPEDGMWVNECIQAAYVASETGQRQEVSIPNA